ncbi:YncE family protein [Novosphingobium sp.]|uniref:YncE family protein n=1 Tax=Novosphingobium sp. TaxID=1874826 RepID=UPI003BAD6478
MLRNTVLAALIASSATPPASAEPTGQAPGSSSSPAIPISNHDRVYAAEQFSNTVSVTDPASNVVLGVIRLGEPQPANFSPLYRGQVLVHGLGFSPDHRTLVVVSIGSNSLTFIDTATNTVKHTTYLGRSPHEAFFTPDNREVWVTIRGEDYVSVIDAATWAEKARIKVPGGPGMAIFSPDGRYGYVCSSFNPETVVIAVAEHRIVGRVAQPSPFCPNIAASPDGEQVWFTLKDTGKVAVFAARPPFALLKVLDTGPITNHVNFVAATDGVRAYVTVGGRNEVQVFRTSDFAKVTTIPVGKLPHGIWPSGDGSRVYVGLENDDGLAVIDTATNKVVTTLAIGQAPQALVYVPGAVLVDDGREGLQPLGIAGLSWHLVLAPAGARDGSVTSVSLFDQGLVQIVQAAVTGLEPGQAYLLGLAEQPDGGGAIEALAAFTTNPAGAAIVNATGPIRQIVRELDPGGSKYLVIAEGKPAQTGRVVQIQRPQLAAK